ncbi:MAG TPA: CHAT domain-containing protein, partial [bacterium]|nr:CHAT domain-containing protein [bacterium]
LTQLPPEAVVVWPPSLDPARSAPEGGCLEAIHDHLPALRLWHFAGHGKFDPADPAASYLACGDDRLTVAEFLEGRFRGEGLELVVLAACETAKLAAGAGSVVEGFIRALLATGTRAILAGGWKVRDDATAAYMARFYPALLGGATLPAAARAAVAGLWDDGFAGHPYFWAGYQPWGVPRLALAELVRPPAHQAGNRTRRDRE